MTQIVDTNVILIANRQHDDVSAECVANCARHLSTIMKGGRIAVDDAFRVLKEYQNKTNANRSKGPGDTFVKWVLQNLANPARVDRVRLEPDAERGFASFPEDERLANFDPPDRKFVAVACAHPERPPISQAADSKWLGWNAALQAHGVRVEFLCPCDIERFEDNKRKER